MPCPFHNVRVPLAQLAPMAALDAGVFQTAGLVASHEVRTLAPAPAAKPQAPPAHWLLGHLPDMKRDLLGFFGRCERDFGAVVPLRLYTERFFLVNDPRWIQKILVTDDANFVKPTGLQMVKPLLGDGLVSSEGEYWRSQRALIQPSFHKRMVDGYAGAVAQCIDPLLEKWDASSTRDVYEDMSEVTLDIVARALFGADISPARPAVIDALRSVQDFFNSWRRHYLPLPIWLPLPACRKLRRAVDKLDAAVHGIIDARRACPQQGNDLLSRLLEASRGDDSEKSRRMLRDELVVMILAGHETSAAALSWALVELARHPRVMAKVRDEIDGALAGRTPTAEDLPQLPYLGQVVKEVLRLYPSLYNIGRVAKEAYEIEGHTVRPGQNVIMCQWSVQRSRRHYDDPDAFVPERWETDRARNLPKFAYFPFGGGPRNCIGAQFSLLEMKMILASAIRRYDFAIEPGASIVADPALSLRPLLSAPMTIRRRGRR
jgi:cytochrome P450